MMIKSSSRFLVALSLGIAAALMPTHVMAKKPNILLILVDDMGYSDIYPFGGEMLGFRAVRKGDFDTINYLNNWLRMVGAEGWLKDRHKYWFNTLDWEGKIQ